MLKYAPIGLSVLLLAGCGSYGSSKPKSAATANSAAAASPSSGQKTVRVSETEFALSPSSITLASTGTYTIEAVNKGTTKHGIAIDGNGVHAQSAPVEPRGTATLNVKLTRKGSYELFCPVDHHRAMGMQAKLVVGTATAGGGTPTAPTSTDNSGGGYGGGGY